MDLEKAEKVFRAYVSGFDEKDDKISLKVAHTYGVMVMSEYIGKGLGLSKTDMELAKMIALLHDLGRFEQLKQYHTFDDSVCSHAEIALKILFEDGMIRSFVDETIYDDVIYKAIKNHSQYEIDHDVAGKALLHAKIIRDADKLDNARVKTVSKIETLLSVSEKRAGVEGITDYVYHTCMSHQSILSSERKTHMDMWISYFAHYYDLNFPVSYKYIRDNNYIEKMYNRIKYLNPETYIRMKNIKKELENYVELQVLNL